MGCTQDASSTPLAVNGSITDVEPGREHLEEEVRSRGKSIWNGDLVQCRAGTIDLFIGRLACWSRRPDLPFEAWPLPTYKFLIQQHIPAALARPFRSGPWRILLSTAVKTMAEPSTSIMLRKRKRLIFEMDASGHGKPLTLATVSPPKTGFQWH